MLAASAVPTPTPVTATAVTARIILSLGCIRTVPSVRPVVSDELVRQRTAAGEVLVERVLLQHAQPPGVHALPARCLDRSLQDPAGLNGAVASVRGDRQQFRDVGLLRNPAVQLHE